MRCFEYCQIVLSSYTLILCSICISVDSVACKSCKTYTFYLFFFVLQEKDAALDRWQEADQEIDRLQRELQVQANSKFETVKRYLPNLKVILKKKAIFIDIQVCLSFDFSLI